MNDQPEMSKDEFRALEREIAAALFGIGMYVGEPCRICGQIITPADLDMAIFAGYSADQKSRAAHGPCWFTRGPQSSWAYPDDAQPGERPPLEPVKESK